MNLQDLSCQEACAKYYDTLVSLCLVILLFPLGYS